MFSIINRKTYENEGKMDMKNQVIIYPLKNKFCYIVGMIEYANYYGSIFPHSLKVFLSLKEAKKYKSKRKMDYVIIRRKISL